MVGRLSPARRRQIIDLLAGLAGHDEEAMLEVLLDWRGDEFVDEARLAADLGEFAFDYADIGQRSREPIGKFRLSGLQSEPRAAWPREVLPARAFRPPFGTRPAPTERLAGPRPRRGRCEQAAWACARSPRGAILRPGKRR